MDMPADRPRREEYADQTPAAVIDAPRQLFAENGFFQTKVEQIAKLSRVSPATVYAQCGGKQGLLRLLMNSWTETPAVDESYQESLAADDAALVMQTLSAGYLQITRQWGDVIRVVIDVAPHDAESAAVLATAQERHNHNLTGICRHLEDIGALRDGVDARLATRIITYYYGIDGLLRTRDVFGWSLERANTWLLDNASAAVLRQRLRASGRKRRIQTRVDPPGVAREDLGPVAVSQRRLVHVAFGVVPGEVAGRVVAADRAQHLRREQDVARFDHRGQQVDAGLVVHAGVEEDVVHQQGLDRRALLPGGDAEEPAPVVGHRAAAVRDHEPQRREPAEPVPHQQLHEGGGVRVEVVRAERVRGRVARGGHVDHGRDVELDHLLVQREPVRVGQRRRGPPRAGRVRVQVAADEPELGEAAVELFDAAVERLPPVLPAVGGAA